MWEQLQRAMVENATEVCGSVRVGGKNPKSVVERLGKSCGYEKGSCLERGAGS